MTLSAPHRQTTFLWGTASAAYQVEGAATADGRGESIWDRFCDTEGKVRNGDNGRVACDFYHRYREDIALMRELGITAFRFSIAWPRVVPDGRGRVNQAGLDFYDRLVEALLENGIAPFATLYHWDLPQRLEDAGGWPVRDTAEAFVEYVAVVAERLGDRVEHWITQNEPWVSSWLGYGLGVHAPGRRNERDALAAGHHVLLAHGLGVGVLRELAPAAHVGLTVDVEYVEPVSSSSEDARAATWYDGYRNRWFLDPIFRGSYPADMVEAFRSSLPPMRDDDLRVIAAPIDFLGVNYYQRIFVTAGSNGDRPVAVQPAGLDRTAMGWEVYPEGLHALLLRIHHDYSPGAIYVTENGACYTDVRGHDGTVSDPERIAYIRRHAEAVDQAVMDGVPVAGYFVWSLCDNFEWAEGYARRFGIVYVDYPTLVRVPKDSFRWYRDFIRSRSESTPAPEAVTG